MANLYLVRHAHSEWSPEENRPLSEIGLEDAKQVACVLASFPITEILSSPYLRAIQTITPFAEKIGIKINIEPNLRERELGDTKGSSFKDAMRQTWLDVAFSYPEGESILQAQSRALQCLKPFLHLPSSTHIAINTHGNLLTAVLNYFDPGIGFQFWENLSMPDIYSVSTTLDTRPRVTRIWK